MQNFDCEAKMALSKDLTVTRTSSIAVQIPVAYMPWIVIIL